LEEKKREFFIGISLRSLADPKQIGRRVLYLEQNSDVRALLTSDLVSSESFCTCFTLRVFDRDRER